MKQVCMTTLVLFLGYSLTLEGSEYPDCDGFTTGNSLCGTSLACGGGSNTDPDAVSCSGIAVGRVTGQFVCDPPPISDPNLSIRCETNVGTNAVCTKRAPCIKVSVVEDGQTIWYCAADTQNIVNNSVKATSGYVLCIDQS